MSKLDQQPPRIPLVDSYGKVTPPWRRYFDDLQKRVGGTDAKTIDEIETILDRTVHIADYLERTGGDVLAAFELAFAACSALINSGAYSRAYLELGGLKLEVPPPGLVVPSTAKYTTMQHGTLVAAYDPGEEWTETDADDIAHLAAFEKVSEQGKEWIHKKPVLTLETGCIGFQMVEVSIDGQGDAEERQSAGVRVKGNTADRKWIGGKVEKCATYGGYIGNANKNEGQIDIDGVEFKVNDRNTRLGRNSYGLIVSGNDMGVSNCVFSNAHACLLVTTSGATVHFDNNDFFNGARFDIEGFQHRTIEYHGNTCTFRSRRHGNGQAHWYSHDVFFFPTKWGITEGTGDDPPISYHHFYPSKLDDDLGKFGQFWGETPIDLITEIAWFFAEPGDGITTSWAIDTAKLTSYKGYVTTLPSGKFVFLQMADTDKTLTLATMVAGAKLLIEDKDSDKEVGLAAYGNAAEILADGRQFRVQSNGILLGGDDNANPQLGTDSKPFTDAYLNQVVGKQLDFIPGATLTTPASGNRGLHMDSAQRLGIIKSDASVVYPALLASTDASAVPSGAAGELSTVKVNAGSAVSLTTATPTNLGNFTLGAGKWDVFLNVVFVGSGATVSGMQASISSTSATLSTAPEQYGVQASNLVTATGALASINVGPYPINSATSTTLYAVAQATFSAGTMTAYCYMYARRPV